MAFKPRQPVPGAIPAQSTGNYCPKCKQKRISCGGRCNVCGWKLA
jgi:hypothetical protein